MCKQKTAYELRISDWSSDVCSSELHLAELELAVLGLLAQLLELEQVRRHGQHGRAVLAGELAAGEALEQVVHRDGRVDLGRQQRRDRQTHRAVETDVELHVQVDVVTHVQVAGNLRVAAEGLVDERVGQEDVERVGEVVPRLGELKLGRASCRERVCQYV